MEGELVSPEGTQEGKEYSPSSSHQTAVALKMSPEETQDVKKKQNRNHSIAEVHIKGMMSLEPRLLHLPIHRKALNSLT